MSTKTTIPELHLAAILMDLADAAKLSTADACSSICSAVANLIAGSGTYGGSAQARTMDAATKAGFVAVYYAGATIRVTWPTND